jgi:hypothetical protein
LVRHALDDVYVAKAGGNVEGRHPALVHFVDVAASATNCYGWSWNDDTRLTCPPRTQKRRPSLLTDESQKGMEEEGRGGWALPVAQALWMSVRSIGDRDGKEEHYR